MNGGDVLSSPHLALPRNIFHTNERGHFVSTDLSPNVWSTSWAGDPAGGGGMMHKNVGPLGFQ